MKSVAQLAAEIVQEPALGRRHMLISRVPMHQLDAVKKAVTRLWESGREERKRRAAERGKK
jgi:hypothetical protein